MRNANPTVSHGFGFILLLVFLQLASCNSSDAENDEIVFDPDVAVPMRDGVVLRADVYRPAGEGPFPVLVYRTPYNKHGAAESYQTHLRAVERGYAVVLQDVRGRYASEGVFEPYYHEGADGYDTIEWAAAQSWSNGDVGTFGLSYPGAAQWLAAIESPPSLKAMAPAMTFSSPRNFFYMNGVFDLSWLPWIYFNVAPDARERQGIPGITSYAEAAETWDSVAGDYLGHLPLIELPFLREEAPYYFEWLAHPPEDAWWDWAEIRGRYSDVDAAVLNMSGWYDESYGPEGAITNHNGLVASRSGDSRSHLIMGPWKHGVIETGEHKVGDLDFGSNAGINYDAVILRFFDQYLKNEDSGLRAEPAVNYFVMGSNEWRKAQSWPPEDATEELSCFGGNGLRPCSDENELSTSTFIADPKNPVTDPYPSFGPHDYSELQKRADLLTFDSELLLSDVTIAGNVIARIFLSCDCRDMDLWVRLQDVYPDGRAINMRSPGAEVMRASYRDRAAGRQPLEPGQVYEIRLDNTMVANTFKAGHRIRAQISASFAPHLSRNLQTGQSESVSSESQIANITIHHNTQYPSALILPVIH
ncbi:MAG: CocE/NonD family hydrolase [Proteobacteria bacterium]|nr:CocE/NonD family hydrolase [Pseudomonadota bacterium]